MPFVPAPRCVQVEVRWILDNQKCENRFFVNVGPTVTEADINDVSAAVLDWVTDEYAPLVNGAISFTEIVVTDWSVANGLQVITPVNITGGTAGAMLPNESSFCVSLRTGFRGRSARGRFYMPPPDETSRSGINNVTATYRNNVIGMMQALITAIDGHAPWRLAVVQFVANGVALAAGVPRGIVNATAVDDTLDSQRRRKPGNGQ